MTVLTYSDDPMALGQDRCDPLGDVLGALAAELAVPCLVESRGGAVLAHARAVGAPTAVIEAILSRRSRGMYGALTRRRSLSPRPGGPVQGGEIDGQPVTLLPVAVGQQPVAWLWVLTTLTAQTQGPVDRAASRLASLLAAVEILSDDAGRCGQVDPAGGVPGDLAELEAYLLVPCATGLDGLLAVRCLRDEVAARPLPGARVRPGTDGERHFLLLAVLPGTPFAAVHGQVRGVVDGCAGESRGTALVPVRATIRGALRVADAVLSAGLQGCATLPEARSALIRRRLAAALGELDDVLDDPVAELVAADDSRGTDFARSLLAWLARGGDVGGTSRALGVHPNTLRYRLRRAEERVSGDLADPTFAFEVYLRLTARTDQKGR